MTTQFLLAQASPQAAGASGSPRVVQLTKPPANQSITVQLDGTTRIDFSQIANENLTLVRVGDQLVVAFDNHTTIALQPVFSLDGQPLPTVTFELAPDHIVTAAEFATLFPITTDVSVLPAAGPASVPSGADFHDLQTADALGGVHGPLALLTSEAVAVTVFSEQVAPPLR